MKTIMSPFKRLSSKKDIGDATSTPVTPSREDLKINITGSSADKSKSLPRPQSERVSRSLVKSLFGRSKSMTMSTTPPEKEGGKDRIPTPPMTPTEATREMSVELFRNSNLNPEYVVFGHQTYNFVYDEKHWEGEAEKKTDSEEKEPNENDQQFKKIQDSNGNVSFLLQRSASEPLKPRYMSETRTNSSVQKKKVVPRTLVERFEEENLHPEYVAFNHPRYHFIYDGRTLDEHTLIFTAIRDEKTHVEYTPPKLSKVYNDDGTYFLSIDRSPAPQGLSIM